MQSMNSRNFVFHQPFRLQFRPKFSSAAHSCNFHFANYRSSTDNLFRPLFCGHPVGLMTTAEPPLRPDVEMQAPDTPTRQQHACNKRLHQQDSILVSDIVHGPIELSAALRAIVDTPQFQRLRRVHQLGITYYVYPNAVHSRFEHSLGVCHLAGKWARRVQQLCSAGEITDVDVLCVEIAGLCHDLGHGPLSHLFDTAFVPKMLPGVKWKHEVASVAMFDRLLEQNENVDQMLRERFGLNDADFTFIKEAIDGKPRGNDTKEWKFGGRPKSKSFLYDIVSNKHDGFDVDRFDYFLRDSAATSVVTQFSSASLPHLLHGMDVRAVDSIDPENRRICYSEKLLQSELQNATKARMHLHEIVYHHKTTICIENMICEAMILSNNALKYKSDSGTYLMMSESINDMSVYEQLDDSIVSRIRRGWLATDVDHPGLVQARQLIERIDRRQLYKLIGTVHLREYNDAGKCAPGDVIRDEVVRICADDFGVTLSAECDVCVRYAQLHHGSHHNNPLYQTYIYNHKNPNQPPYRLLKKINKGENLLTTLPSTLEKHVFYVYAKNPGSLTGVQVEALSAAVKKWSQAHEDAVLSKFDRWFPPATDDVEIDRLSSKNTPPPPPKKQRTAPASLENINPVRRKL